MEVRLAPWLRWALLGVTFALPAGAGEPQSRSDTNDSARTEALNLADQSEAAYKAGRFAEAAELLRKAYEVYRAPVLLYNLARVEESAGNDARAADAYQRYLTLEPGAPDRRAIEQRIVNITRRIEELERAEAKRQQASATGEGTRPSTSEPTPANFTRLLPWMVIGLGSAELLAGGTLGALAARNESAAKDAASHADAMAAFDRAEGYSKWANVCFVAGGITTAAGLTLLLLRPASAPPSPRAVSVTLGVGPGQVMFAGRF